jgi:hypothetical protein
VTTIDWVETEFAAVNLGDKRREKRLTKLVSDLSSDMSSSIVQCCDGWAETKAGYRLLSNEAVTWTGILEPHRAKTVERMGSFGRVLCIQDTTELDFTGHPSMQGLGRLNHEYRHGMYCHPTLAVSETGIVLGVLDAWMWARQPVGEKDIRESIRWTEGYQRVAELKGELSETELVYVADREGDIRELMTEAHHQSYAAHWLVRAKHNRVTGDGRLWERLNAAAALGTIEFTLPRTATRQARQVELTLRVERVTLPKTPQAPELSVTAILATEVNPPDGESAIEWRLLTDEKVTTLTEAAARVAWYRQRWMIEVFFRTLKTGCKVEELQLNTKDRLEKALVIYMIIAWRVLLLMTTGRELPDLSCEVIFDREEWQAAWIVSKKTPLPLTPPRLGDMLLIVARFGGFLARKNDGHPGAEALWRGLQRISDFAESIASVSHAYGVQVA